MRTRYLIVGLLAATMLSLPAAAQTAPAVEPAPTAISPDALEAAFREPPAGARPRIWWHWMNGNITEDGLAKDLAWMKRIGIGGVTAFDVGLATPQIVPTRLAYMTPEWKHAFRFATRRAADLGLEMAIASSPGWSETGGPWVRPENGMKKLVWSETVVAGGRRFTGRLPVASSIAGPFQDAPFVLDPIMASISDGPPFKAPDHYGEVAVLAYRVPDVAPAAAPRAITIDGKPLDGAALTDASAATGLDVPRGSPQHPTTILLTYDAPQLVRSITVYAPGSAERFGMGSLRPRLEASTDGETWRTIADLTLSGVPTTVAFAPVTASRFRIVMASAAAAIPLGLNMAPGIDLAPLAPLLASKPTIRLTELRLSGEPRVHYAEAKAGFAVAPDYQSLQGDPGTEPAGPAPGEVIDLTARMRADGTLDWIPPKGRWRVVRLGWSLTGTTNHPASSESTGLEVDKLDGAAVRDYLDQYLGTYRDAAGADLIGTRGIGALLTDSTEIGAFNWTPRLIAQFQRLRGYDPTPWLPALTGALIGTRTQSEAFLYDFRRTLADLHASEHYGTVAAAARENGLKLYGEALEDGRPSLGDDMAMRRYADYPMAALWAYPSAGAARTALIGDMRGAASVAHVYGQNIAAAESMTSAFQYWAGAPADLRHVIDLEFANGINRPVIHSAVHQPVDDKQPGLSLLVFGQSFNRHETWANMAKPWMDYMARNSLMLQQGRNHADVAYFYGEDAPLTALYSDELLKDVPSRYAYDFVNPDVLLNVLKVEDGSLAAASGARYRVLYLGAASRSMTLPVLRRIADLAAAGATIVGDAPTGSPSLGDDAQDYARIVARLWSGQPVTPVGTGRVVAGSDVEAGLRRIAVAPDFDYARPAPDSEVLFVHRELADGDAYFVDNRRNRPETIEARFRVTGKTPERWRADTGRTEPLGYRIENGVTIVPLAMDAEDSFFVVFRKAATAQSATVTAPVYTPVATLNGPWSVTFQPGRGAPASLKLATLGSLSEQTDPAIRYFSGTATYAQTFALPAGTMPGGTMLLDLGRIGDVAEVRVNGQAVGTVWHAPYRLDIGKALRKGRNAIEIRVANLWVNRLIGDRQPGAKPVTFTTLSTYTARAPLRPSGLIGPVTLLSGQSQAR